MISIREEEKFKQLLEKLFLKYRSYNNLINFVEDNGFDAQYADDFAEELLNYEKDIQEIFNVNLFCINSTTLSIIIEKKVVNNINIAIKTIDSLNFDDFEKLCALYLRFLGCTSYNYTQHSHDQGIDFVGVIKADERTRIYYKGINSSKNYLIGQAKHYNNEKVKSREIRELAGSLYLLKYKNFGLEKPIYESLDIKAFTPIYAYFITSCYFSESALRLCRNCDIIPVDKILLAITFGLDLNYCKDGVFDSKLLINQIINIDKV